MEKLHCYNQKHQIILKLMYGCGLLREEVCTLKTEDVNIPEPASPKLLSDLLKK